MPYFNNIFIIDIVNILNIVQKEGHGRFEQS